GNHWCFIDAYGYLRAKFIYSITLFRVNSKPAAAQAVDEMFSLLVDGGFDKWGVRDYIPHLLLRLRQDKTCLQFLRFCDTPDPDGYDTVAGQRWAEWRDTAIKKATRPVDAFVSIDSYWRYARPSLSHLVALTFLRATQYLDITILETSKLRHTVQVSPATPPTRLPRAVRRTSFEWYSDRDESPAVSVVQRLRGEYETLLRVVDDTNPYFWPALIAALVSNDTKEPEDLSDLLSNPLPGSKGEADRVVYQSIFTWREDADAVAMLKHDTSALPNFTPIMDKGKRVAGASQAKDSYEVSGDRPIARPHLTGSVIPERFYPLVAAQKPRHIYRPVIKKETADDPDLEEFDNRQLVCATVGLCKSEGKPDARAAWAVTIMTPFGKVKAISGRLEDRGPFHDYDPNPHPPSTIRAELRAAVAAVRMLDFSSKGIQRIVIATESDYVAMGATCFVRSWMNHEPTWHNDFGDWVEHRDLWILLLGEIQEWHRRGHSVKF
ncbi:hypothetical protein V8F20_003270, partial [Naviculisporaceae sp. PSN 640]